MSFDYSVFDSLQDGAVVIDSKFAVFYGNQAAANVFSSSVKRLSNGKPLVDFINFKDGLFSKEDLPEAGFSPTRELEFTTNSQRTGSVQVSLQIDSTTQHSPENEKRWIIFLRDVSLEKVLHQKYISELEEKERFIESLNAAQIQLEDYSKNLELKIEARTTELKKANRMLAAILDSLDQGIVVFERTGFILPYFSKMSRNIFKSQIESKNLVTLISKQPEIRKQIRDWMAVVFEETLPFEDTKGLGIERLGSDITDREIALSYNPLRDSEGGLQAIVLVATDRTNEMKARKEAERERNIARRLVQITKFRSQFRSFALEANAILAILIENLNQVKTNHGTLDFETFARGLHTFKGGVATFAMSELVIEAHEAEEHLVEYFKVSRGPLKPLFDSVKRIQIEFNLFLEQNRELYGGLLSSGAKQIDIPGETALKWLSQLRSIAEVKGICSEIEGLFACEEIGTYFAHLDESLAELAASFGKRLKPILIENGVLRIEGKHYRDLFTNLIHVFRNAIDHGLEEPGTRLLKNKDEAGLIKVEFQFIDVGASKRIRILISDDGAGIDPNKIRERMRKLGFSKAEIEKNDHDVMQTIFTGGFSIHSEVSLVSGRGVGMFAARSAVEKIGGSIVVTSVIGSSTQVCVEVPFLVDSTLSLLGKAA